MLTRRDLLVSMLGLPLAAAACREGTPLPRIPQGTIIGASAEFGHRIRDVNRTGEPDRRLKTGVLVVGGGIAGLSAAWRLTRQGVDDLLVAELEREPGGVSLSGKNEISSFPWGAHYIPVPLANNRPLIELLDEMDVLESIDETGRPVAREQYLCHAPQERIYYRGRWHSGLYLHAAASPEDLRQYEAFYSIIDQWVSFRDDSGRRAFIIPRAEASDDDRVRALDQISMREFMDRHGLTSPRLRWYVDYACRDDYGLRLEETSAWAGVFYYASRVATAGKDAEPLITWPEGNGRFVRHFTEAIGNKILSGLGVFAIENREGGVVARALTAEGNEVVEIEADRAIFAAPQFLRPFVISNDTALVDEFEYSAWLVANLSLAQRPAERGFPLSWDNVFYESPSLGYVCATHQRGMNIGPTIFTYYWALCDSDATTERQRLLSLGRDDWAEVILSDITPAHPEIRDICTHLDIARWGHAMVLPRPGFMWSSQRIGAATPQGSIHFANTDLSGLGLFEEAFHHGIRAADEVRQALSVKG